MRCVTSFHCAGAWQRGRCMREARVKRACALISVRAGRVMYGMRVAVARRAGFLAQWRERSRPRVDGASKEMPEKAAGEMRAGTPMSHECRSLRRYAQRCCASECRVCFEGRRMRRRRERASSQCACMFEDMYALEAAAHFPASRRCAPKRRFARRIPRLEVRGEKMIRSVCSDARHRAANGAEIRACSHGAPARCVRMYAAAA